MLFEVRWHGRGGQGVVTASDLLARAAIIEGKYAQHFPEFGPERMGAPIRAFTRISDKPIELHTGVYEPEMVVVIDPTLLIKTEMILQGMREDRPLVVNAKTPPQTLVDRCKEKNIKLYVVDAYTIAIEVLKRPFYNTPMLGAAVKVSGLVKLDSVLKAAELRFSGDILKKNIEVIKKGFNEVKEYA
ncbi:MAG: pyruvate synthase subunit porC [Thermoprotei archaeon]|nr:MAG: pyruvate synthase subunit porC [Thermoprotei archaeon]RLE99837.1 MAG: pyruvate synthase subunit porC [Thermoprotei archaeon]HDI75468.1 pyruvate synthase subunit porC [Thermoprotei archaeon]